MGRFFYADYKNAKIFGGNRPRIWSFWALKHTTFFDKITNFIKKHRGKFNFSGYSVE